MGTTSEVFLGSVDMVCRLKIDIEFRKEIKLSSSFILYFQKQAVYKVHSTKGQDTPRGRSKGIALLFL